MILSVVGKKKSKSYMKQVGNQYFIGIKRRQLKGGYIKTYCSRWGDEVKVHSLCVSNKKYEDLTLLLSFLAFSSFDYKSFIT